MFAIHALEKALTRIQKRIDQLDTSREKDEYRAAGLQEAIDILEEAIIRERKLLTDMQRLEIAKEKKEWLLPPPDIQAKWDAFEAEHGEVEVE
jgi:hypothetical protein